MPEKVITIEFDGGEPTISPTGYAGKECRAATKPAEIALGLSDTVVLDTADARKRPVAEKVRREV